MTGTPAKMASSMAGRPSFVPGILMNRFGRPARVYNSLAAASVLLRVVREQRRHLERNPAVHRVGLVVEGAEQIGGLREVLDGQLEEQLLTRFARLELLPYGSIIGSAFRDGLLEDGRIRGQPRHRQLGDVSLERAGRQQIASDIVKPDALAKVVQQLCGLHLGCSFAAGGHGGNRLDSESPLAAGPSVHNWRDARRAQSGQDYVQEVSRRKRSSKRNALTH